MWNVRAFFIYTICEAIYYTVKLIWNQYEGDVNC